MSPASDRLGGLVAGVRRHLRNRSALAALCWAGGGLLVLWLVAWAWVEPEGWRQGSDVPVVIVTLMALWVLAVALGARFGVVRWFGEVRVSGAMERAARLRVGEVRGALELARSMPPGVSASLAGHAAARAARDLGAHSVGTLSGELGDAVRRWTQRGMAFLTASVLLVVGLAVLAPTRTAHAWAGLVSPLATMADPEFVPLVVTPGTAEVVRGSDVEVRIEAEGRAHVELAWQATGDVQRLERIEVVDGRASHVIQDVSAETEYRVRGDVGSATELFHLVPVDPLFVGDLVIGIEYPPHTGLPEEEHRMSVPVLRLPVGTVVTFAGRANRTLAAADLVRDSGDVALRLDVEGAAFGARWTPREDGTYAWRFRDAEGAAAELIPDPLRVELVPDQPPNVRIPVPGADTLLPLDLRQPLVIEAGDDYGLRSLELVAHRVTALGQRQEPVIQRLDLEGTRGALARPVLDVSGWELMPGDTVRYFARVTDNAPRGQVAVSPEYVLRMPSAADMRREVERSLDAVADRVEALSEEAGRLADDNRARAREAETRRPPQRGMPGSNQEAARAFEEREAMRQALEQQEALSQQVDSMLSELGDIERAMENAGQADPALRAQLRELQELLQEAASEDLGERMRQLAESLERQEPRAAGRSLEEMAREQELLRERLEESLDRFRRAAVEQDFRATTSEAEDLARQERAVADALREDADPAERAAQQQELASRAEDLESSLERLEERLRELDEQAAADGVSEAANRAQEAESGMREAGQRANRGERQEAAERAEQAAQQMSGAAKQLQEAQQAMAEQNALAAERALLQTADDALALARRQADLREQMRGAGREQISGMRGEEASLLQGLRNMAENLRVATEGQVPDGREISEQMGRAMESIQRTVDAMERPRSLSGSPMAEAERAVADLNELALRTLASADRMGQDGQGQQQGAEQDMQEALGSLAQEQGSLANDASQIVPMQLGQQAMAEQAQQLAQGQQAVSDRLGELSDMPSSEGALGDLEQFAAEAAELAAELAAGRLTAETAQRQERLFHRLLDAGRSLEEEEFSEERESEEAGAFERAAVSPLDPSELGVMPYRLPDSEQLRALTPGVRQLILDYFERLNRDGPTRDGGLR